MRAATAVRRLLAVLRDVAGMALVVAGSAGLTYWLGS